MYCLMSNHYHLIVETPLANLSEGMRHLNSIYTQRFNRRHANVGHLFQGRFKAMVIDSEEYLLEAARYVMLNPIRAKMTDDLKNWGWSSYRATAGLTKAPDFLYTDALLDRFSKRRSKAQKLFAEYVQQGIIAENPFKDARGGVLGSSEKFIRKIREVLDGRELKEEHAYDQKSIARPDLKEIFSSGNRDTKIAEVINEHRYRLKEVGDILGLHYSTVSRIAKDQSGATNSKYKT